MTRANILRCLPLALLPMCALGQTLPKDILYRYRAGAGADAYKCDQRVNFTAASVQRNGVEIVLNKWDGTTAPTADEDSGDGYAVGSVWVDVTGDAAYVCVDSTVAAAVWVEIMAAVAIPVSAANGGTGQNSSAWTGVASVSAGTWSALAQLTAALGGTGIDTSASTGVPSISTGTWSVAAALGAALGGTGIDTSASTGVPSISTGTWSVAAALGAALGGTGIDTSAATGVPYVTAGTWATEAALDETRGGTGQTTITQGDLLFGSAANTLSKLGAGTNGYYLKTQGPGANPIWAVATSVATFPDLTDTPANYSGAAGQYVRVNSTPDGLEFTANVTEIANATQWFSEAFTVPDEPNDDPQHFEINIDDTADFSSLIIDWDSRDVGDGGDGQTGCKYFDGSAWQTWPSTTGLGAAYEGQRGAYTFQSAALNRGALYHIRIRFHDGTTWGDWVGDIKAW